MPRFAANLTMLFTEHPFAARFAAAQEAGFSAVEFQFPYAVPAEEVRALCEAAGVEPVLFNFPPGDTEAGERGLAALPARAADFTESLQRGLTYARIIGVPRLHLMAGIAPAGDGRATERFLDALKEACDRAEPEGVDILIEPINGRDMPGYFLDDFDRAAEIIDRLERPNLRLQFDIYHRQILHGDVSRALQAFMPIIGHIQTASVPDRAEPGTGELDDAYLFALIDRLGYQGHIGCEYRPAAGTRDGLGWFRPPPP